MNSNNELDKETLMEMAEVDPVIWLELYGIKNEVGRELEWKDHLFLFDIISDFSPKQVIKKAAQIGFTTLAILKATWFARHKRKDIIYTMPSQSDVEELVSSKMNRIVANNPILQEYVKDKDTIKQKQVGENIIFFRGTWSEKAALMVSSDLNIYDEVDRSNQMVVEQYASRLQASDFKGEWYFSNPSVLGNGVARYWSKSDQKEWFITCGKCQKQQTLIWPENVDVANQQFICRFCKKELSRDERRVGEWIAQSQGEWSGYHISLLMAPWITAKEIIHLYETKGKEYFYNFVLGEPFIGEGNTVTPELFSRNLTREVNSQEDVIIGCDSGIEKHYVLGNREGLFYYNKTENWDDIESLLRKFTRSVAILDAMPDITGPRKLKEKFPGRVFLNFYSRDRKTMQLVRWGQDKEFGNVLSDRNRLIQMVIDEFADRRIALQGTEADWHEYVSHWLTLYRLQDVDLTGTPTFKWETSTGKDHFVHATVLWRIGMDKYGRGKGVILQNDIVIPPTAPPISFNDTDRRIFPPFIYADEDV